MKKWQESALALLALLSLTSCGTKQETSTSVTKEEQSSAQQMKDKNVTTLFAQSEKEMKEGNFYQASDTLREVLQKDKNNEKAKITLKQITTYQAAKKAFEQKDYKTAEKKNAELQKMKDGSSIMLSYSQKLAKQLKGVTNKKEKQNATSTDLYIGKNLSTKQRNEINEQMQAWCERQAKKGGMATVKGAFQPYGGWSNPDTKVTFDSVDGPIMMFDGLQEPVNSSHDEYSYYQPTAGKINELGGMTFYVPGSAKDEYAVGPYYEKNWGKKNALIDRYIWADNGKIYELKEKFTHKEQGSAFYCMRTPVRFQLSEDKAALAYYQQLLAQAGATKGQAEPQKEEITWNSQKAAALAAFMERWGNEMEQTYEEGEVDISNPYGECFGSPGMNYFHEKDCPKEVGQVGVPYDENKQKLDFTCGQKPKVGQYQIVAFYGPKAEDVYTKEDNHYYAFAIKDGKPVVLNADEIKEGHHIFKPTENQKLQQGFAHILES